MFKWIRLIGCLFITSSMAQNNSLYSIKLKSGLIIKCELVNLIPDSILTIRQYGTLSAIKCSEIVSIEYSGFITTNPSQPNTARSSAPNEKSKPVLQNLPEAGWTTGFQIGASINTIKGIGADIGTQFRFSSLKGFNNCEVGFCFGFEPYFDYGRMFASTMAETRYYLKRNMPSSPIIYAQAGYGFNLNTSNITRYGGINAAFGIGKSSRTGEQNIFTLMYGFRIQNGHHEYNYNSQTGLKKEYMGYLIVGFEVKLELRL